MFHKHIKKGKSSHAKPLKDLTAVVPSSQLLLDARRQDLIKNISECSALELARFESLCLHLIHNLVNHCQSMPETSNSYFSLPCGLLDHALNRTEAALSLFRKYLVQEDGADLSEEQTLWMYALFSAGILQGMGKLQLDYRVDLFDVNGQLLKQWSPLLESMASVGDYYYFEFQPEGEQHLRRRLNLLMARLLMPASGYAWIISNPEVLAVWLALLNEDMASAGTLGAILLRADAIAIQRYFNEFLIKNAAARSGRGNRIGTFVDTMPELATEKERVLGIEFIKWMEHQLAKGVLMINKAPLFIVPGGMFMSSEIFKLFVREHPEFKNWQAVQAAFLSLGLHNVGVDGSAMSRFEQANNQHMENGIVFADANYGIALPNEMKLYNTTTGDISSISALELMHAAQFNQQGLSVTAIQHLAPSGAWQLPAENNNALLQVGYNSRG